MFDKILITFFVLLLSTSPSPVKAENSPNENEILLKDFFNYSEISTNGYLKDEIYPRGQIFPFSYFSIGGGNMQKVGGSLPEKTIQASLRNAKNSGATMIGPQYEMNDRILEDAELHDLKAIYTIFPSGALTFKNNNKKIKFLLPDSHIVKDIIKKQVEAVMDNPYIAWWYIMPEELRYWRRDESKYLQLAVETIRSTDPQQRPIWMYEPNNRNAAGLSHNIKYFDISGKGTYPNYANKHNDRIWVKWSIDQEILAIKNNNPNAIPIAVLEMFKQSPHNSKMMIPKWVKHDSYLSLISGAKGIVVYSLRSRPNFTDHDLYRLSFETVSNELTGELNLGNVFLFGEQKNDIQIEISNQNSSPGKNENLQKFINTKEIGYGHTRYLFICNSSNENITASLTGFPKLGVSIDTVLPPFEKYHLANGSLVINLSPLDVKAFRFYNDKNTNRNLSN